MSVIEQEGRSLAVSEGRMPAFCWLEKDAMRLMRRVFAGNALVSIRALYSSLAEICSDHPQWSDEIGTNNLHGGAKTILAYSGLSFQAYKSARDALERLKLIQVSDLRDKHGHRIGHHIKMMTTPSREQWPNTAKDDRITSLANLSQLAISLIAESVIRESVIADVPIAESDGHIEEGLEAVEELPLIEETPPSQQLTAAERIINQLNNLRSKAWAWARYTPLTAKHAKNVEHINGRLSEEYSEEDLVLVLEYLACVDGGKEDSRKYFDCVTPFNTKNFERNLAMARECEAR